MGKVQPHNRISKSNSSTNPDRGKQPKGSTMRTRQTINRLNMYKNFKAKRDPKGKIIKAAPFQKTLPSGTVARVEPNRRWFGNTRVISQDSLQNFKEVMKIRNPYEIMLKQTKLPVSLLNEKKVKKKSDLLAHESFSYAFGKKAQRVRPRLSVNSLDDLVNDAMASGDSYCSAKDVNITQEGVVKDLVSDPHFKAGQSKRIWNELFKVIDSSDVILYVLDARNPGDTRSKYIEDYLRIEKPHKHVIFVLNKVDLVPVWVTKQWKTILSRDYPTLVFHANITKPLGKSAMMGLLRQFARLHAKDRQQISVGIIGYPNVGKSSIINALKSKKVCNVAPIAGETKVWQYVSLMKTIYLIDCPGVVYPQGESESDLILKGVVRIEYLDSPELYIPDVVAKVKKQYLKQMYQLPAVDEKTPPEEDWTRNVDYMLEVMAKKSGRLLKGGEPDIKATAKRVLNDFQRGKLPYFVKPQLTSAEEEEFAAKGMIAPSKLVEINDQKEDMAEIFEKSEMEDKTAADSEASDSPDDSSSDEEEATADVEEMEAFDIAAEPLNKFGPEDTEEKINDKKGKNEATAGSSISSKMRRQLQRALLKMKNRAGRFHYKEVNVKQRKRDN